MLTNRNAILRAALTATVSVVAIACGVGNGLNNNGLQGSPAPMGGVSLLSLHLTDKPSDQATSVNVNIVQAELFVEQGGNNYRIIIGQNIGMVDLLTLRNGVLKGLGNLLLPPDVTIHQMRFILGNGNNLVKTDGTICPLNTPSAQQSGVKLLFTPSLTTQANMLYDIVLDFDVDSSIVFQGNGDCSLKPVIKVKSATATPVAPPPTPIPTPQPSPSATPSGSPTPTPTPSTNWEVLPTGPTTSLPITGTSGGAFTTTSSPTDPVVVTGTQLWQFSM